jgi:NTE family protein/lysophospholipid hydrolase
MRDPGRHHEAIGAATLRLFGPASAETIDAIRPLVEWVSIIRGEVLFRQGTPSDSVFVVVSGRVRVHVDGRDGASRVIGECGPGEVIGEMGFFTGAARSASVIAARDAVMMKFSNAAFEQIITSHPQLVRELIRVLIQRVQSASLPAPVANRKKTIAVVSPEGGVVTTDFAPRLVESMQRLGTTRHLRGADVDRALDIEGAAQFEEHDPRGRQLIEWLNEQEDDARFVVYESDSPQSPWTSRCLRQADEVVVVAHARERASVDVIDAILGALEPPPGGPRRILVLLHEDGNGTARGAAEWTSGGRFDEHHHVRSGSLTDLPRLARFLAGKAIGLALGGGGARGFAHIGVLHALEEAGVVVDMVGGTSMGALIAAEYAMGRSPKEIQEMQRQVWLILRPQKKVAVPLFSIVKNKALLRCAEMMFGDARIEDLWLPFFCVSSNLATARSVIHRGGSLMTAVLASAAIPAVAQPVIDQGALLVDGAILNNLPGDVPHELGCEHVMVSEVSVEHDQTFRCGRVPTLWEALSGRFRRLNRIPFPSILEVVSRSTMLASARRELDVLARADLAFRPPIDAFGLLDFGQLDTLVKIGYDHARARLEEWDKEGRLADFRTA